MKRAALITTLLCCSRPPAEAPQPRGVQLAGVQLTTWRGADVTARGWAKRATLTPAGFVAENVELVTATGTSLKSARVEGELDLDPLAADGLLVKSAQGCEGSTAGRVTYQGGLAVAEHAVAAGGCGFTASGQRVTYDVRERRAEVEGPVRTRLEAAP